MGKNNEMIIVGDDCDDCKYFEKDSSNNNRIMCKARKRKYYYGQCIPCEDKEVEK